MLFNLATSTVSEIGSVSSGAFSGVYTFVLFVIGIVLAFWVIEIIISLIPSYRNRGILTQNIPQEPFSQAESEEYRYKEKLWELSQKE